MVYENIVSNSIFFINATEGNMKILNEISKEDNIINNYIS